MLKAEVEVQWLSTGQGIEEGLQGSEWSRWYPTAEIHTKWIHRLGNLVLLARTKNVAASNYDFDKKKATYFAGRGGVSPFALTTQVLQEREWTPEVVERRQAELIAHLCTLLAAIAIPTSASDHPQSIAKTDSAHFAIR